MLSIAGDPTYAPPEQLYQYAKDDWVFRRLMADVYRLGSLALFLLTGDGATAQLSRQLATEHHWQVWTGSPVDLLPILRRAAADIIGRIDVQISGLKAQNHAELLHVLSCLLEPDPELRGIPAERAEGVPNAMQRLISRFDVLSREARLHFRRSQKT